MLIDLVIGHRPGFQFIFKDPEFLAAVITGQNEETRFWFLFHARHEGPPPHAIHENSSPAMQGPMQARKLFWKPLSLHHHEYTPRGRREVPHIRK